MTIVYGKLDQQAVHVTKDPTLSTKNQGTQTLPLVKYGPWTFS